MAIIRLQGEIEQEKHLYYEFNTDDEPLGEGGMGKVFKGRCVDERTGIGKDVAIKFMFSDLPSHAIERARREASIQLRNDNLVEMLGFIETVKKDATGTPVRRYHVVSELLEGVMLDDLLQGKTTDQKGNPVPFAEKLYRDYQNNPLLFAVTIIRSVLSGLMALHDACYIHRDIDPTNIMITRNGHIKLIDFGIAKPINTLTTCDKSLTTAGVFMGKPWYAAPELVLGDVKHQNVTTDIYAIGILFYQLYMGARPFEGAHHEVLDMQLHKPMPLRAITRKDVKAVIGKATNKKQELRYQSAAEFRVAVDALNFNPVPPPVPWQKWLAVGGGVTAVVALTWVLWPNPDPKPVPTDPQPIAKRITYSSAVEKLKAPTTSQEGLQELETLTNTGNYDATYLLSRLKFDAKNKKEFDNVPDSIWVLQLSSKVETDYKQAHELLEKAVAINPNDCNSLYALGFDYLVGDRVTYEGRRIGESKKCLEKALQLAQEEGNQQVVEAVEKLFKEYANDFKKGGE